MNFIVNGGYLARFSRITYWTVPGSLRTVCPPATVYVKEIVKPHVPRATSAEFLKTRLCVGNLRVSAGPFVTQIRWKDPFLNRDLEFPSFDNYRKEEFVEVSTALCGDRDDKPGIAYTVSLSGLIVAMYGVKSVAHFLILSMAASAEVLALANVEVNLDDIEEGKTVTVKWRGKPLFIKHRTNAEIERERKTSISILRDPETDEQRAQNPTWLIVIGICTHLGCVPIPNSGDFVGGFYCPCHGSHYDAAGRARKGPAPLNLVIPPYKFLTDSTIVVG